MKKLNIMVLSLVALALGRSAGYCTANAKDAEAAAPADLNLERIAALEKQVAELSEAKPTAPVDSTLALLAKGADLRDLADVTWRIQAGLSAKQAVDAAVDQIEADKTAAAAKKGAKK